MKSAPPYVSFTWGGNVTDNVMLSCDVMANVVLSSDVMSDVIVVMVKYGSGGKEEIDNG